MNDEPTLTDSDYDAIAERLWDKDKEEKGGKETETPSQTVSLTDEDRREIASHLLQLQKDEAEAAEKDKNNKRQERKNSTPNPVRHFLDRPLIGGR